MARSAPPRFFGVVFFAAGLLFLLIGAAQVWRQGHLLARAVAMPAEIVEVPGERVVEDGEAFDVPASLGFRYLERGEPRIGHALHCDGFPAADDELRAAGFRPGQRVTAWRQAEVPDNVFLLRRPDFMPYLFILFPLVHATIGLAVLLGGWSEPRSRARTVGRLACWWWGVTAAAFGHYLAHGGVWDAGTLGVAAGSSAVGIGITAAWRACRVRVPLAEAPGETVLPDR